MVRHRTMPPFFEALKGTNTKTKQNKTKQNKTKQNKTKQNIDDTITYELEP